MIHEEHYFTVVCEVCFGETADCDSESAAVRHAQKEGWTEVEPGRWACSDAQCVAILRRRLKAEARKAARAAKEE